MQKIDRLINKAREKLGLEGEEVIIATLLDDGKYEVEGKLFNGEDEIVEYINELHYPEGALLIINDAGKPIEKGDLDGTDQTENENNC